MPEPSGGAASADHPAPTLTQRRGKVREVPSRFMSLFNQSNTSPSSNPTGLPRSRSSGNCPPPIFDENHIQELNRSFEKSSSLFLSTLQRKNQEKRINNLSRSTSLKSRSTYAAAGRLLQDATSYVQKRLSKSKSSSGSDSMPLGDRTEDGSHTTCVTVVCPNTPSGSKKEEREEAMAVHSLKMMSNHLLQWRFANAKAETVARAQKIDVERILFSFGAKISNLVDNVTRLRSKLAVVKAIKSLTTVKSQMPYLDAWSRMEEDYSTSLCEASDALLISCARFPVSGNVRVDVVEIGSALRSALKMVETIDSYIQGVLPIAEEMDTLLAELAGIASEESGLLEHCKDLISETYDSQLKEFSLRSNLLQACSSNRHRVCSRSRGSMRVSEEWAPPETKPYIPGENLQKWLTDAKARDQFVIRAGPDTEVLWNDARQSKAELVYRRTYWTESFVQWSPLGTYLATVHKQCAQVWGGATTFSRLARYAHPQVKLIDFSPGERFLVTYSSHEPSSPRDT